MARDYGARAQRRYENVRDDDVRSRRNPGRAFGTSAAGEGSAGPDGRLHRFHLLAAPAREYADDVASAQDRCDGVSPYRGVRTGRPRQRSEPSVQLGDDGDEDWPDRPPLWM